MEDINSSSCGPPRSSSSGPAAGSTARRGAPGATAPRPWTRSSRSARPRPGRTACSSRCGPSSCTRPGLHPETYFDSAAIIIGLILLGRWLEARAKGRTAGAVRRLVGLQATTARRIRDGARRTSSSRSSCPATCCASGRATRCRSTASSSRARRRWTSRCSPASRCRSTRRRRRGHRRDDQHHRHLRVPRHARRARHGAGPDRRAGRAAQGSKAPIQRLADLITGSSCRPCSPSPPRRSSSGSRSGPSRGSRSR